MNTRQTAQSGSLHPICSPSWWGIGWHKAAMRYLERDEHEPSDSTFRRMDARFHAAIERLDRERTVADMMASIEREEEDDRRILDSFEDEANAERSGPAAQDSAK